MRNRYATRATRHSVLASLVTFSLFFAKRTPGQTQAEPKLSIPSALTLRISAPKDTYETGSPVPLHIEFQNLSDHELMIGFLLDDVSGVPSFVRINIFDASGAKVPGAYTLHLSPFLQDWGHGWWVPLGPGYFYGRELYLTPTLYPFLTKSGDYQLSVQYEYFPPENKAATPTSEGGLNRQRSHASRVFIGKLTSNQLRIRILPSTTRSHLINASGG